MRVLAIDYGLARTGVALSDPTGTIASPYRVIPSRNYEKLLEEVGAVIGQVQPQTVILGFPNRTDGAESEMCLRVRSFADDLTRRFGVTPTLRDEKYTTVIAAQKLHDNGVRAKEQRSSIDAAAAAVLLQDYLDEISKKST